MPPSKEDLEFQRKIDELRDVMRKLGVEPDEQKGKAVLARFLADLAANNTRAA